MSNKVPRFVLKYGHSINKLPIEKISNKLAPVFIIPKYIELLQYHNIMYLFQWRQIDSDIQYIDHNVYWQQFTKLLTKPNSKGGQKIYNSNNILLHPIIPPIYSDLLEQSLINTSDKVWISKRTETRAIFGTIKTKSLNDLIDNLDSIHNIIQNKVCLPSKYTLQMNHLCLKISNTSSGENGLKLMTPEDNLSIFKDSKNLDYQGLLRLARESKTDSPLKKLLQLIIKQYGLSHPTMATCGEEQWLLLSRPSIV